MSPHTLPCSADVLLPACVWRAVQGGPGVAVEAPESLWTAARKPVGGLLTQATVSAWIRMTGPRLTRWAWTTRQCNTFHQIAGNGFYLHELWWAGAANHICWKPSCTHKWLKRTETMDTYEKASKSEKKWLTWLIIRGGRGDWRGALIIRQDRGVCHPPSLCMCTI